MCMLCDLYWKSQTGILRTAGTGCPATPYAILTGNKHWCMNYFTRDLTCHTRKWMSSILPKEKNIYFNNSHLLQQVCISLFPYLQWNKPFAVQITFSLEQAQLIGAAVCERVQITNNMLVPTLLPWNLTTESKVQIASRPFLQLSSAWLGEAWPIYTNSEREWEYDRQWAPWRKTHVNGLGILAGNSTSLLTHILLMDP